MNELTILLVEDDVETCKNFARYIETKEDIILVNITNSATQALLDISYYMPDIVILDLELHHGSGNGLDVLHGLKNINANPYILVTTNNSSNTTYEHTRQLGTDFIMYKHQKNYSEEYVVDFLSSLKSVIKEKHKQTSFDEIESPEYIDKKNKRCIIKELDIIGINPKSVGYQYLIEAILLLMKGHTSNLCNIIALNNNKSEPSVERAMQNAINRAWKTTDIDILSKNYTGKISSDKGSPTVTEFVHYYVNKIKNNI